MRLVIDKQEIRFLDLTWSGSKYNAARQVSFTYPSKIGYAISPGSILTLHEGNRTLFEGIVFSKQISNKSHEMNVVAYDRLIYFLKSEGSYNFKTTTVGNVIKKVAADVGVPVGSIADSETSIKLDSMISMNLYEVILQAYREVKNKTKIVYMPVINGGKLSIIKAGETVSDFSLENGINLLDSSFGESIENVKNKILIVDDKGNRVGEVKGDGLTQWGTFQGVYQKEEGKNSNTEAKSLLHGMDLEASVEALGNINCISGKAVTVLDPTTKLKGLFYIDEDTHYWNRGQHTMSLQLNFKNMVDDEL